MAVFMRIARFYFIFFKWPRNVLVYWVADQRLATNDNHRPHMPICGRANINSINVRLSVVGVINVPIANINKNAAIDTICSVVFILPMENRALGTGISIFWVPRNSRNPDM